MGEIETITRIQQHFEGVPGYCWAASAERGARACKQGGITMHDENTSVFCTLKQKELRLVIVWQHSHVMLYIQCPASLLFQAQRQPKYTRRRQRPNLDPTTNSENDPSLLQLTLIRRLHTVALMRRQSGSPFDTPPRASLCNAPCESISPPMTPPPSRRRHKRTPPCSGSPSILGTRRHPTTNAACGGRGVLLARSWPPNGEPG